ncbi:Aste57867_17669 [Aphanomyces stellatus]|uniref:Aste57867_17669 protein n=1 Tax=Aphanomyces stellatus TaxID=120398 RepID=A0A485L8C3_9STRA|nr:hypothetical protein As57867_017608 [Aphanomyces stellatus]VFT94420.1 Aste57867_17669 [Aphanomyces stellatus]
MHSEMGTVEIHREELVCCICLDIFTKPVTFPCGHTFDLECCRRFFAFNIYRANVPCPVCAAPLEVAATFDFSINAWIDQLARQAFPDEYARATKENAKLLAKNPPPVLHSTSVVPRWSPDTVFLTLITLAVVAAAVVYVVIGPKVLALHVGMWYGAVDLVIKLGSIVLLVNSMWHTHDTLYPTYLMPSIACAQGMCPAFPAHTVTRTRQTDAMIECKFPIEQ